VVTWEPEQVEISGAGSAELLARSTARLPTVENPISTYVLSDPATTSHAVSIWLSNPFDGPIDTEVTQVVPAGVAVVDTDGTLDGSSVRWSRSVDAHDLEKLRLVLALSGPPGASDELSPAMLTFVEPTTGAPLAATSNTAALSVPAPVRLDVTVPRGQAFVADVLGVAVLNQTAEAVAGTVSAVLSDAAGNQQRSSEMPFSVGGMRVQSLDFTLPPVSAGLYPLELRVRTGGGALPSFSDVYQVVAEESPTTTTTTTPARCDLGRPGGCEDGNPCTDDHCDPPVGCIHDPRRGDAALVCAFERSLVTPQCRSDTLPKGSVRKFDKAERLVLRALSASKDEKRTRLLLRAYRSLDRGRKAIDRAVRRKRDALSAECAESVRSVLAQAQDPLRR
jgi:hypothetical protein